MTPRDMDLIRELLLRFEQNDTSLPEGRTMKDVGYHVKQMIDAGLIEGQVIEAPSPGKLAPKDFFVRDITPKGHDFLDAIRNDTFWAKLKNEFQKKAVAVTVELVILCAKELSKSMLGLNHP